MSRSAAVFCHQAPCLRILKTALHEAGIDYLHCRSQQQALELTLGGKCMLLIVDFALPESGEVVRLATLLPPPQKPVVLALGGEWPGNGEAFQSGAHRILYRPLVAGQVRDALQEILLNSRKRVHADGRGSGRTKTRLTRSLAKSDRRIASRSGIKTLVYLELETGIVPAIGIDVSEQGLAVRAPEPIRSQAAVPFRCLLPGTTHILRGRADIIWTDNDGRAGMFFSHLPPTSRKLLKHWLSRSHIHTANAVRVLLPQEGAAAFS